MTRRWRPSLWIVLGGALGATLALSLAGLVALRYIGPEIGFREAAILVASVIGAMTGVLGLVLLRLLLRPLAALDAYATAVRTRPGQRIPPPPHFGTREIRSVALSVIEMAGTLRNRETTVRSYTNHVTHELKTPVSSLRAAAELLSDSNALAQDDRALVDQITRATTQLEVQLRALRDVAKAQEEDHNGRTQLSKVVADLAPIHPGLAVTVAEDMELPLSDRGAAIVLGQLFRNAVEHGATKAHLRPETVSTGRVLCVIDDGPGISEGNRGRVFDPFFTTRRDTGGTGMGLWIVATLLRNRGGDITLVPDESGAQFRLRFPRSTVIRREKGR